MQTMSVFPINGRVLRNAPLMFRRRLQVSLYTPWKFHWVKYSIINWRYIHNNVYYYSKINLEQSASTLFEFKFFICIIFYLLLKYIHLIHNYLRKVLLNLRKGKTLDCIFLMNLKFKIVDCSIWCLSAIWRQTHQIYIHSHDIWNRV